MEKLTAIPGKIIALAFLGAVILFVIWLTTKATNKASAAVGL